MRVAVIPARGGSKRIPKKNVRLFCGKPMISYSIDVALKSDLFDKVVVSTDDHDIAEVSAAAGADIPFIRPPSLSDDHATTLDVMEHAVNEIEELKSEAAIACCLYATAPLLQVQDISEAFVLLENRNLVKGYVVSLAEYQAAVQRALTLDRSSRISMRYPQNMQIRTQDLQKSYHDAGQFYWGFASSFRNRLPLLGSHSIAYVLPKHRVQDIDEPEDWLHAEALYRAMQVQVTR